jgi:uncharacterized membrane protein YbhN (UPF0104 family)
MRSDALLVLAKLLVGVVLLTLIATRVPAAAALAAVRHLPPKAIGTAIGLYFLAHGVNALKLRLFLPGLRLAQAWRFTMIAVLYGLALPGQLAGDAVKAVRLMRAAAGGDMAHVLAGVALDKIVGLFALLVLTALGIGLEAKTFGAGTVHAASAAVVLAMAGLATLFVMPLPPWLGRWGETMRLWRETTLTPPILLLAVVLGALFQVLSIGVFMALGAALGLHLAPPAWAVIVGLVSLTLLLPITVAGIGLRDASLVGLLGALGHDSATALALSVSLLALNVVGGLVGLIVEIAGRDRG